jgi:hypothetical protein
MRGMRGKRRNADEGLRELRRLAASGELDAIERLSSEALRRDDPGLAREAWYYAVDVRDTVFPLGSSPTAAPPNFDEILRIVEATDAVFHRLWEAYQRRMGWGVWSGRHWVNDRAGILVREYANSYTIRDLDTGVERSMGDVAEMWPELTPGTEAFNRQMALEVERDGEELRRAYFGEEDPRRTRPRRNGDGGLQAKLREALETLDDPIPWMALAHEAERLGRVVRGRVGGRLGTVGGVWMDADHKRWAVYFFPQVERTADPRSIGHHGPMWAVAPERFSDVWIEDILPNPMTRKNGDEDLRDLARQIEAEDDNATLIERLVREARRRGAWSFVNAAMEHANYPTWNRFAPVAYEGAASWPAEELNRGTLRMHELLERVATASHDWQGRFYFEDHVYPLLNVLIGRALPARWFGEPGVRRVPFSFGEDASIVRAWIAVPRAAGQEYRADVLTAVLDNEERAITIADAWTSSAGVDAPASVDVWVREWAPHHGGSWQRWARNTEAFDRLRIPIDLARRWLEEARRTWGTPPESFPDLAAWARRAAARNVYPPGWSVSGPFFDEARRAEPSGFVLRSVSNAVPGGYHEFVWRSDDRVYGSPAALAWGEWLVTEGLARGWRHTTGSSIFDPEGWSIA